jgi:hypothetical protein
LENKNGDEKKISWSIKVSCERTHW